ncbi:MAG: hypothetical protein R3B89_17320 [Polyangiaceae bacterium]
MRQVAWFVIPALCGCSSLLGLDEFKPAEGQAGGGTGGDENGGESGAASGGSSGRTGVGGSAGTGGASCVPETSESCYTGPASTLDVGVCKTGSRTCDESSMWGECTGEILPSVEDCATPATDENCDGFECGIWGVAFEQAGGGPMEVVPTSTGGAVLGGIFSGGISIGGKSKSAIDAFDVFVAGLDSSGGVDWLTTLGGTGSESITALTAAGDGQLYVAVYASDAIDYGDGVRATGTTLIHLTPDGSFVSSRSLGGNYVFSMHVDTAGMVYAAGSLDEPLNLGAGDLVPVGEDALVLKLESDLTLGSGWARKFGGDGTDSSGGITVDTAGNVYFVGTVGQGVNFDGNSATSSDAAGDAFIAKLNPAGTCVALRTFGAVGSFEWATGVVVDAAGSATVLGTYKAPFTLGTQSVSATDDSLFLARFDFSNTFHVEWLKGLNNLEFTPNVSAHLVHLAIDDQGSTVLTASAVGAVDFGNATAAGFPSGLPTIAKFDKLGNHLWHRAIGGSEGGFASAANCNAAGEVFAVGTTSSPSFDIGTGSISSGQASSYIVKFGK